MRNGTPYSAKWNAGSDLSRKFHDCSLLGYIRKLGKDAVIIDPGCSHFANTDGHFSDVVLA